MVMLLIGFTVPLEYIGREDPRLKVGSQGLGKASA